MNIKKNLALVAGLGAVLSGASPAWAQLATPDPDQTPPADEITVVDPGLIAALPVPAGPRRLASGPAAGCDRSFAGVLKGDLALTDDQYEKLFGIKKQLKDQAGPKIVALRSTERDLKDVMSQAQVDRKKVLDLQSKINDQRADLANLRVQSRLDALDVLTDAQRKQLRLRMIKGGLSMKAPGPCAHARVNSQ